MTAAAPTPSCPKCGATVIQTTLVKRSSVDVALAAEYARAVSNRDPGASDTVALQVCQRCGCQWVPRTAQERQLRALSGQLGPEAMKAAQADEAARAAKLRRPAGGFGLAFGVKVRPFTLVLVLIIAVLLVLVVLTG